MENQIFDIPQNSHILHSELHNLSRGSNLYHVWWGLWNIRHTTGPIPSEIFKIELHFLSANFKI